MKISIKRASLKLRNGDNFVDLLRWEKDYVKRIQDKLEYLHDSKLRVLEAEQQLAELEGYRQNIVTRKKIWSEHFYPNGPAVEGIKP